MSLTNFPNGITSFGVPVMGGATLPTTTGNFYFVHASSGNDSNSGLVPDQPLATIDAAVNKTTASQGDVIVVMPGHAETIASATSLVLDVAGISVIGLGHGRNRPVLSFSATASRIPISADNVLVSGLVFLGAVADIVSGVTITGDDVTLRGCDFEVGSAILEFLQMLDIDAATRATVEYCRFIASATAGTNNAIRLDATVDSVIRYCEFRGDFTTAAISGNAGSAAASTNAQVLGNRIENLDTTAGLTLDHTDATTGITSDNHAFTLFATAPETAFDAGATLCVNNYTVNAVDESGLITPETLST
jgi:hypothetical protein